MMAHPSDRVVIYGPGNLGCYFGGRLLASGIHVVFVGRPSFAKTAHTGFVVKDATGGRYQVRPGQIEIISPEEVLTSDTVIVAVKSGATGEVAEILSQIGPHSIVSIQNGLRNSELLADACLNSDVSSAIVPFNVIRDSAGAYVQTVRGQLVVQSSALDFTLMLSYAEIPHVTVPDIGPVQRGKLLMNLNNAIHALSGRSLPAELRDRRFRRILADAQDEALNAFRTGDLDVSSPVPCLPAHAIPTLLRLPDWIFVRIARQMLKNDDASSSMRDDLEAGRPTEIDWLNGEVCRLLKSSGRKARVNARLVEIVKKFEATDDLPNYSAVELDALVNNAGNN
ncbi:2-dehydropantoate 2-reductase [Nocardia asteroides]|uniref:2-dehydropantoate 2-reductase n=1 Tax=Nocardia asteroides TaxID=1824 RepID=UPI0037C6E575